MEVWLSYSLHDLLLFSPESYFRLYESANERVWPWQLLISAAAMISGLLIRRVNAGPVWIVLTLLWVSVGYVFFHTLYREIYPMAGYFGHLFYLQALLLMVVGLYDWQFRAVAERGVGAIRSGMGWLLFAYALLFHPLLNLITGRDPKGVELAGVAPDPTALLTLALLLLSPGRVNRLLLLPPLVWLFLSGLTHLAMEHDPGLLAPLMGWCAVLAVLLTDAVARRNAGSQT